MKKKKRQRKKLREDNYSEEERAAYNRDYYLMNRDEIREKQRPYQKEYHRKRRLLEKVEKVVKKKQ